MTTTTNGAAAEAALLAAASAPRIAPAIAGVDEQLAIEQQRVDQARAELADATRKLEALVNAREQLANLEQLYTGTAPPPCPIPHVQTASGNGNGRAAPAAAPARARRPRGSITDAAVLDALRSLGGRGTVAETAGAMECNIEAARRRLNALVEVGALDVSGAGNAGDPSRYTIKTASAPELEPGSPEDEAETTTSRSGRRHDVNCPSLTHDGDCDCPPDINDTEAAADDDGFTLEGAAAEITAEREEASTAGEPERELEPGESPALDAAVRAAAGDVIAPPLGEHERDPQPLKDEAARRASPNLSRLPRREAPAVSKRTQRAIAASASPPAVKQPATCAEKVLQTIQGGAPDARWKVRELVREIAKQGLGVFSHEQIGHALSELIAAGKIRNTADWFALPEAS